MSSLRVFKTRRDDLLHEDTAAFDHHLGRFIEFCRTNPLVQQVLGPLEGKLSTDVDAWSSAACEYDAKLTFPSQFAFDLTSTDIDHLRQNLEALTADQQNVINSNLPDFQEQPLNWNWASADIQRVSARN